MHHTERRPVRTKPDFVRRYAQGEFGNASPTWRDIEDFKMEVVLKRTDASKRYSLRSSVAGDKTQYNLNDWECLKEWRVLENLGLKGWYASEMSPHQHNRLQGELLRTPSGLQLHYSMQVDLPMKDALRKDGKTVYGTVANILLQQKLTVSDFEWVMFLLDTYEDHVVEFTAFNVAWGTVLNSKCVIWEVRLY